MDHCKARKCTFEHVHKEDTAQPAHLCSLTIDASVEETFNSWLSTEGLAKIDQARGYKTFFMLNSAEHEIFSANKYENANNCWHFHIY